MEYPPVRNQICNNEINKPYLVDESPHLDQAVEWWFAHGAYVTTSRQKYSFMISLFRQKIPADCRDGYDDTYHAIVSIFDAQTRKALSRMIVHASTLDFLARYNPEKTEGVEAFLMQIAKNELLSYGPPEPITISDDPVFIQGNPLEYRWEALSLRQREDGFLLSFPDPINHQQCRLFLRPAYPCLDLKKLKFFDSQEMAYNCYPRMEATGTLGAEFLSGQAWFDHQFGEYRDSFLTAGAKNVLGWDWIAMNFDDGTDAMMMIHKEMKTGNIQKKSLLIRRPDQSLKIYTDFAAGPVRYWRSGKTHICYPLQWQITVPDESIEITFTPLADDQEILYLGLMRAIWEGAGTVEASLQGKKLTGRGRLELYGYGYVFDIKEYMEPFVQRFDRQIEAFFPRQLNEEKIREYLGAPHWQNTPESYKYVLSEPIWDLMSRKGKHWRPIFGVLFLDSLGHPSGPYESLLATMLELNHTGALIIDDIEDSSLLRRGDTAVHLKYGTDVAINAGNTLYFLPYLQIANHPHLDQDQKFHIYRIMVNVWTRSHFGQSLDIYWSKHLSTPTLREWLDDTLEEKILQMYNYKTASAVEAVAEAVCIIARTDENTKQAYISLGRIFGTVFQIVDDINNFSDSKEWRKTCGEDLSQGKLTYVIVRAIKSLSASDRRHLITILTDSTKRQDTTILKEGIDLIRQSGVLESCREEAQNLIQEEWKRFSQHIPPSDAKTMIRMLISGLTNIIYES